MQQQEGFFTSYPPWANIYHSEKEATKCIHCLFGIGRRTIEQFINNEWVLARKSGKSMQARCKDVDKTMLHEALGENPPKVNRLKLSKELR